MRPLSYRYRAGEVNGDVSADVEVLTSAGAVAFSRRVSLLSVEACAACARDGAAAAGDPEAADELADAFYRDGQRAKQVGTLGAIGDVSEPPDDEPPAPKSRPVVTCLADVAPREIKWLWRGRIALGRITLFVGMPGAGKSYITCDMAARVSTGTPWPDGAECERGSVLLVSAEDDPGDTIRPRLDAHHADCSRVHLLSAIRRIADDGTAHEICFTLQDLRILETALAGIPDCKLVVIDPVGSYLGGSTDSHRDNEVRAVLAPLAALAERTGVAVLIVAHRRKSGGGSADESALGSRAFTGLARTVWHLSRDPANRHRRLFLAGKNNLAREGDGLAMSITGDPIGAVCWERDPVSMNADDGFAAERESSSDGPGRPRDERDAAREWLAAELADEQEHPVDDLKRDAGAAGIAWRTAQRAASELRVLRRRTAFGGGYVWRVPRAGNDPA